VVGGGHVVHSVEQLRGVHQHGLLPRHGQRHGSVEPLHRGLLLHQLHGWHAAGAVPRGLLLRSGRLGNARGRTWRSLGYGRRPLRLQHVLPGRRHGHHVGRLRELRERHGQHAGLVLLHARHPCLVGGLVNRCVHGLWGCNLPCVAHNVRVTMRDAYFVPYWPLTNAPVLRYVRHDHARNDPQRGHVSIRYWYYRPPPCSSPDIIYGRYRQLHCILLSHCIRCWQHRVFKPDRHRERKVRHRKSPASSILCALQLFGDTIARHRHAGANYCLVHPRFSGSLCFDGHHRFAKVRSARGGHV